MDNSDVENKSCCFTGHRIIRTQDRVDIADRLYNAVCELYNKGIKNFISGGALGFDMLAAEIVIKMRETDFPDITLELMLPCFNQDLKWHISEKNRYARILSMADKIVYVSENYSPMCMALRNRKMVDSAVHCIAYVYKSFGGAAYTVKYVNEKDIGLTLI